MSIASRDDAQARINELFRSVWALSALSVALERGFVRALAAPATVSEIATSVALPLDAVVAVLGVLQALGLAASEGERWMASPGFAALTDGAGAAVLRADLRSTLGTNQHLVEAARDPSRPLSGWHAEDPLVVAAQGVVSEEATAGMAVQLGKIPGLAERLSAEGAALLDVGAGAGGACIALARHFPNARVVGLEPSATAIELGRENVGRAGLAQRIELRQQFGEQLTDEDAFDFAWVAQMFIPDSAVDAVLRAAVRALKKGGVFTTAAASSPGTELPAAIARLRSVVWGGGIRFADDVIARLQAAGLTQVTRVPVPPAVQMVPIFGTKP